MLLKLSGMIVNFGPGCFAAADEGVTGSVLFDLHSDGDVHVNETVEEIWAMLQPERDLVDLSLAQCDKLLDKLKGD